MNSDLRVLHILNSAYGGSALSTLELISALQTRGVRCSLVCLNNASQDDAQRIRATVNGEVLFIPLYWMNKRIRASWWKRPLIELLSLYKTRGGARYQGRITELIRRENINLIHTSTIVNPEGAIASKRNGIPHVWHVRELVGPDMHYRFYNYAKWSAYVSARCKYLIANSAVTRDCLLKYFDKSKIRTIPNGIAPDRYSVKVHTNQGEKRVVGMVGSVTSRWKNHEFFIRTAALFADRSDVEFRIYGSLPASNDPYLRRLGRLVGELGIDRRLQFISFGKPEEIMWEIDVMFHPSDLESFGRIFIEAMAGGIPVVAVNRGGALEMVKDGVNGYLVPMNDTQVAAKRIAQLLESPELRSTLGNSGRQLVEQEYSLGLLCDRMISLYNEVVSNGG